MFNRNIASLSGYSFSAEKFVISIVLVNVSRDAKAEKAKEFLRYVKYDLARESRSQMFT